ncbi:MAG TPA: hypothetical protein VKQ34_01850 [Candidatus Saccharimonadales bacterium]|nr:hypothetical protein [Candidatus Saccharimonadales bacterium]
MCGRLFTQLTQTDGELTAAIVGEQTDSTAPDPYDITQAAIWVPQQLPDFVVQTCGNTDLSTLIVVGTNALRRLYTGDKLAPLRPNAVEAITTLLHNHGVPFAYLPRNQGSPIQTAGTLGTAHVQPGTTVHHLALESGPLEAEIDNVAFARSALATALAYTIGQRSSSMNSLAREQTAATIL